MNYGRFKLKFDQTFQPVINLGVYFVYHHWECKSIYRPLSYPLKTIDLYCFFIARPELVPEERAVKLTDMLNRVADKILRLLPTPPGANHAPTLSFWMGNSSELLHFLKSDRHITAFSLQVEFNFSLL